jgi:hypothetical protein
MGGHTRLYILQQKPQGTYLYCILCCLYASFLQQPVLSLDSSGSPAACATSGDARTAAYAALVSVYPIVQQPELPLNVPVQQQPLLPLVVLVSILNQILLPVCLLQYIAACSAPGRVFSTVKQPVCCIWTCIISSSLCWRWTCLLYSSLFCPWTCLLYSSLCCSWTCLCYCSTAVCTVPGGVWPAAVCFPWTYLFNSSLCCAKRCMANSSLCFSSVCLSVYKSLCFVMHLDVSVYEYGSLLFFTECFGTYMFVSVVLIYARNLETNRCKPKQTEAHRNKLKQTQKLIFWVSWNKPKNNRNRLSFCSFWSKPKIFLFVSFKDILFKSLALCGPINMYLVLGGRGGGGVELETMLKTFRSKFQ